MHRVQLQLLLTEACSQLHSGLRGLRLCLWLAGSLTRLQQEDSIAHFYRFVLSVESLLLTRISVTSCR